MAGDRVDDDLVLAVAPADLLADLGDASLALVVDRLADVVEQPRPLGELLVEPQLGGHDPRQVGDLLDVVEDVLAVRGPVLQPPEELHQLRVDVLDPELLDGLLTGPQHRLVHGAGALGRELLDPLGLMFPSLRSFSRVRRAISRLTGLKPESVTTSGFSSTTSWIPVLFSNALMFFPSCR
jgi:hypothetical protein